MNARTRAKRAVLRDRRRWPDPWPRPVLFGPLSGFDLYLLRRYQSDPEPCGEGHCRCYGQGSEHVNCACGCDCPRDADGQLEEDE